MSYMTIFSDNLKSRLEQAGWSPYKLALEIRVDTGLMYKIMDGKREPSESILEKMASVKELGVSYGQLLAWKMIDKYGENLTMEAYEEAKRLREADNGA